MFEEQTITRFDGVDEFGNIRVKKVTRILKNGVQVGSDTYHRHVIAPGDDISNEEPHIQAMTRTVWTPENVAAHTAELLAQLVTERAAIQAEIAELNEAKAAREAAIVGFQQATAQAEILQAEEQEKYKQMLVKASDDRARELRIQTDEAIVKMAAEEVRRKEAFQQAAIVRQRDLEQQAAQEAAAQVRFQEMVRQEVARQAGTK